MKKFLSLILIAILMFTISCAETNNPRVVDSAMLGAALGGTAGAMLPGTKNKWRAGVIGAAIGAAALGGMAAIEEAEREAVRQNRPIIINQNGSTTRIDPLPTNQKTRCRKIRRRTWRNGKLVSDTIEEVCNSEKVEDRY